MDTKPLVKAVIFDLDGTLIDSVTDIANAMNKCLVEMGYPEHSLEAYKEFIAFGQTEMIKRVLPDNHRSAKDIKTLAKKFWDTYELEWYLNTKTYPGILYMIQLAVARKIKLAILSTKAHYFTKKMIRHFFRGAMIRHTKNPFGIYTGEQIDLPQKPDPTIILELVDRLKTKPENVAFVGDMVIDIETAKAAGMVAIGAAWGISGREALQAAGADIIFDTPIEFASFLETQPIL